MNYEEQILELKKRIEALEKAENKRIAKRKREIAFKIGKFFVIVILIVAGCNYVYSNFVKPYKEKIDYVDQKIDSIENFVDEKWNAILNYNPFS